MLGISQAIDESDTSKREVVMNKLSGGNQALSSDAGVFVENNGRIELLKDGDYSENICDEDDAKSLTLECLGDKSKLGRESQSDRDFVSQSSLTIVSDSNLFQENSQWWSMINNSENISNLAILNLDSSTNMINPNLYNETNNNNTSPTNNTNNPNTNTSNTSNTTNNIISNQGSMSNYMHSNRSHNPTRRRSSLLSDITFESEDNEDDEQTTESGDSSWANNSALLTTARRFAPNYYPGGNKRVNNEIIIEEHQDSHEKLKQGRDNTATTAAPVIPRRRVSKLYRGQNRLSANNNSSKKTGTKKPAAAQAADEFDASPSKINSAYALRAMARGNAAAPTIPKRTSSHNSKISSSKNNPIVYQIYNASCTSIVSSQISNDTEPSFFEDGSAAAAAAAAYLSSPAAASQQEEARTVQTAITSHTSDTPVLKNQGIGRRLPREEYLIESETPPTLPERRNSVNELPPTSFGTLSSFEDDSDEIPSIVHEEEPHDDSELTASPANSTPSLHRLPCVPIRKRSGSDKASSYSSHSSGNMKPASRLNTQPPSIPMRKESNHHIQKIPITMQAPVIQSNRNAAFNRLRLSPHKSQGHQPSQKHKPPTKPTRTNSNSNNRSPAPAATLSS